MFKPTKKGLYQLLGKTKLEDLPQTWRAPVDSVLKREEKANPDFKFAEIRGATPRHSHDDPSDPKEVIAVRLKNEKKVTIERIHIHQDESVQR